MEELKKMEIPVPWQLRTTIGELELTVSVTSNEAQLKPSYVEIVVVDAASRKRRGKEDHHNEARRLNLHGHQRITTNDTGSVTIAFVGPTLIALVIAVLWYYFLTTK
ncbi:hypothetical protein PsorP6_019103 [Peronosclerospora sorghi]|nr:hypothetical protein PsorP6_019103 [Peronosclerospora sorghi]